MTHTASSNETRYRIAKRRIESFSKRFGKSHFYLACHAAFSLTLTPDLLYRLWANFQRDINGKVLNIPWIAVADLLLSNLCDEVGYELYQMDLEVRNLLLKQLQEDEKFGQQRINELSDFLLEYVRQKLQSDDPDIRDFAQTQSWIGLAYTQPTKAARELALAFSKLNEKDTAELVRMASLTETLAEPLAEYQPLLIYARGMRKFARGDLEGVTDLLGNVLGEDNLIKVAGISLPIPKQIKEKVSPGSKPSAKSPLIIWGGIAATLLTTALIIYIYIPTPEGQRFLSLPAIQNSLMRIYLALPQANDLASRILKYMESKNYEISVGAKMYNIIYVEGMNMDGTLNKNAPNEFNDRRMVIEVINGIPKIVDSWQATTEPGSYYTNNPMNPKGAARIKFGQYKAWVVGIHGTAEPHEALIQVGDITVYRDFNKDLKRTGDKLDTSDSFYLNQHYGYDFPSNDIRLASAGTLVGRTRNGHREFMAIIKQDKRYIANPKYVFYTTIISGEDLVNNFPN
ncbi:DNA-binding response regulator, OmpR family, containings REC and winged-helix [Nostoc flagelliforme CCNUN1]|uniref:DNA-binding response regulator, OmpR family, containings REC and winged-helix n=1 Tax=Nostoc flagelliforme CCNUN1 TaxID=2038116 RepID=A0A2K8SPC0_9NOSO|nr:DNA-binding response regulator, OmpR family, containings REC and winged-helix [Nostoc flagelliforme CCNUN1]